MAQQEARLFSSFFFSNLKMKFLLFNAPELALLEWKFCGSLTKCMAHLQLAVTFPAERVNPIPGYELRHCYLISLVHKLNILRKVNCFSISLISNLLYSSTHSAKWHRFKIGSICPKFWYCRKGMKEHWDDVLVG